MCTWFSARHGDAFGTTEKSASSVRAFITLISPTSLFSANFNCQKSPQTLDLSFKYCYFFFLFRVDTRINGFTGPRSWSHTHTHTHTHTQKLTQKVQQKCGCWGGGGGGGAGGDGQCRQLSRECWSSKGEIQKWINSANGSKIPTTYVRLTFPLVWTAARRKSIIEAIAIWLTVLLSCSNNDERAIKRGRFNGR